MPAKRGQGANQHTAGLSRRPPHLEGDSAIPVRSDDPKSPPWKHSAFRALAKAVPPEELSGALEASADPRCQTLLALMTDISLGTLSLPSLARRAGISYAELLRVITVHRLGDGMLALTKHAPQVMEDAAIDAKARLVPCKGCLGSGKLVEMKLVTLDDGTPVLDEKGERQFQTIEKPCWACEGKGKIRKSGDADARELVFETLGLTGKGKGINVNVGMTVAMPSVEDDMTAAQRIIDQPAADAAPSPEPSR